tara:strand:+ start:76 stop:588 length:513 start_codon:yes stop_codon:yes gene_type:complete
MSGIKQYKIIDNFLDDNTFGALESFFMSSEMEWNYNPGTVMDVDPNNLTDFQFVSTLYDNGSQLRNINLIYPIYNKLDVRIPMRVKINLSTVTPEIIKRDFHIDQTNCDDIPWKTAILYMNTNDGYTEFKSGEKVESVANRCVIFSGKKMHRGTTCTNQKRRVVLNINYI